MEKIPDEILKVTPSPADYMDFASDVLSYVARLKESLITSIDVQFLRFRESDKKGEEITFCFLDFIPIWESCSIIHGLHKKQGHWFLLLDMEDKEMPIEDAPIEVLGQVLHNLILQLENATITP